MSLSHLLLVVSLTNFLYNIHATDCDTNCADKPVFTPSELVVKYGDPVAANCSVCEDCLNFGLETSLGTQKQNGTTISWEAPKMTEWGIIPQCHYPKKDSDDHCCTKLPVTLYQPPDNVLISFDHHTGPMIEGHQYTLQCEVQNFAPVKNLIVTFYKGQTALVQLPGNGTDKKPVTVTFPLNIIPSKDDDGGQYWCEAKLDLGPEGPQPPPVVISQKLIASVLYKPQLQGSPHSQITIKEGNPLLLNCSAWGNPSPSYSWTLPSGTHHSSSSVLAIDSVTSADGGQYTCSVSNSRGTTTVEFNVTVEVINITLIIVIVVIVAAVLCLIGLIYLRYYRTQRMGKYTFKDVFRLGKQHTAVPITE